MPRKRILPIPRIWRRNLSTRERACGHPGGRFIRAPWTLSRRKSPTTRGPPAPQGDRPVTGRGRIRAAKPDEDTVYTSILRLPEPAAKIAGHRVLAIDRGEREGILKVSLELDQDKAMNIVNSVALKGPSPAMRRSRRPPRTPTPA